MSGNLPRIALNAVELLGDMYEMVRLCHNEMLHSILVNVAGLCKLKYSTLLLG
jgi:hypothetical protein